MAKTQMQLKPQAVGRVQLYSDGLSDADWSLTGVERVDSLTVAVAASIAASGDPAVGGGAGRAVSGAALQCLSPVIFRQT